MLIVEEIDRYGFLRADTDNWYLEPIYIWSNELLFCYILGAEIAT